MLKNEVAQKRDQRLPRTEVAYQQLNIGYFIHIKALSNFSALFHMI